MLIRRYNGMRKISWLIIFLISALLVAGCGSTTQNTTKSSETNKEQKVIKLGIIQIVEHPSLDAARKGFLDVLKENGYEDGKNLKIDYQNAQGDMSNAQTIAKKFVGDKVDMVLAIATPTSQAMAKATTDIPILITAVTDPVAAGLVKSLDKPGTNVTGTTDMTPNDEHIKLIKQIVPNAKKIGIIYNAGEVNSQVQVKIAKNAAAALNLSVVEASVSNSSEVFQAAQSLASKVDAIYVPGDNTVVSALESVLKAAEAKKIPVIAAEGDSVKRGAIATLGLDYYKLGRQTGEMALQILRGTAKPADMPIQKAKEFDLILNQKAADKIKLTLPKELLDKAKEVIK